MDILRSKGKAADVFYVCMERMKGPLGVISSYIAVRPSAKENSVSPYGIVILLIKRARSLAFWGRVGAAGS